MPNYCSNTVTLEHADPAMIARARSAFEAGRFLEEFIPCPTPDDWYNWNIANWGTKWDVGGEDASIQDIPGGLMLSFDSAWAPPINAYQQLIEQGFQVYANYYEPGMAFAGIWDNGSDDYFEYGGMTADEIEATLPPELDEAYGISQAVSEWEQEQEEENLDIDLDSGLSATNEQDSDNLDIDVNNTGGKW